MKYTGSKRRVAKEILPIILKDRQLNQWYVEPFVGGGNLTSVGGVNLLPLGGGYKPFVLDFCL